MGKGDFDSYQIQLAPPMHSLSPPLDVVCELSLHGHCYGAWNALMRGGYGACDCEKGGYV